MTADPKRPQGAMHVLFRGKTRAAFLAGGVLALALPAIAGLSNTSSAGEAEDCLGCHAGQKEWPLAPDVTSRWFGSRASFQDGGHGDPDNFPPLACTGTMGCHDLGGPEGTHLNGFLEGVDSPSRNTFHLKTAFVTPSGDGPWAIAEAFNIACAESCHLVYGVPLCAGMGHATESGIAYTPRFGYHLTPEDADGGFGRRLVTLPVDSDLTIFVSRTGPDYGLCISCHDPHGTTVEGSYQASNRMIRLEWMSTGDLCRSCHLEGKDEDGGDGIPDSGDPLPGRDRLLSFLPVRLS